MAEQRPSREVAQSPSVHRATACTLARRGTDRSKSAAVALVRIQERSRLQVTTETYRYEAVFFDFVDRSSGRSANIFLRALLDHVRPRSVLDVGCGRGIWLKSWVSLDVTDIQGVDGEYVDKERLHIKKEEFHSTDISAAFHLGRSFDLVQCLEVAEHVPEERSESLIDNIVSHGDLVLFSAATPGQGGENHINERPLAYWVEKFSKRGYECFDPVRPLVRNDSRIEPWYRFNALVFAKGHGVSSLSEAARATRIERPTDLSAVVPLYWKLRCAALRSLPAGLTHGMARLKHRLAQ